MESMTQENEEVVGELIYRGFISEGYSGEADDILYIGDTSLAEDLQNEIDGKQVTVSWYISDEKMTDEELLQNHILTMSGAAYVNFGACYSEYTGYLWTNEEVDIGGHSLIGDLSSSMGKYVMLKIIIH